MRTAISLFAIRTFLYTEMAALPRYKKKYRALIQAFIAEIDSISSVYDFLKLAAEKLQNQQTDSKVKELILGYVYSDPVVYKEIMIDASAFAQLIRTDIFPSRFYFKNAKLVFFPHPPEEKTHLIALLCSQIKKMCYVNRELTRPARG